MLNEFVPRSFLIVWRASNSATEKEKYLARDRVFWYSFDSLIVRYFHGSARSMLSQVFDAVTQTSNNRVEKSG